MNNTNSKLQDDDAYLAFGVFIPPPLPPRRHADRTRATVLPPIRIPIDPLHSLPFPQQTKRNNDTIIDHTHTVSSSSSTQQSFTPTRTSSGHSDSLSSRNECSFVTSPISRGGTDSPQPQSLTPLADAVVKKALQLRSISVLQLARSLLFFCVIPIIVGMTAASLPLYFTASGFVKLELIWGWYIVLNIVHWTATATLIFFMQLPYTSSTEPFHWRLIILLLTFAGVFSVIIEDVVLRLFNIFNVPFFSFASGSSLCMLSSSVSVWFKTMEMHFEDKKAQIGDFHPSRPKCAEHPRWWKPSEWPTLFARRIRSMMFVGLSAFIYYLLCGGFMVVFVVVAQGSPFWQGAIGSIFAVVSSAYRAVTIATIFSHAKNGGWPDLLFCCAMRKYRKGAVTPVMATNSLSDASKSNSVKSMGQNYQNESTTDIGSQPRTSAASGNMNRANDQNPKSSHSHPVELAKVDQTHQNDGKKNKSGRKRSSRGKTTPFTQLPVTQSSSHGITKTELQDTTRPHNQTISDTIPRSSPEMTTTTHPNHHLQLNGEHVPTNNLTHQLKNLARNDSNITSDSFGTQQPSMKDPVQNGAIIDTRMRDDVRLFLETWNTFMSELFMLYITPDVANVWVFAFMLLLEILMHLYPTFFWTFDRFLKYVPGTEEFTVTYKKILRKLTRNSMYAGPNDLSNGTVLQSQDTLTSFDEVKQVSCNTTEPVSLIDAVNTRPEIIIPSDKPFVIGPVSVQSSNVERPEDPTLASSRPSGYIPPTTKNSRYNNMTQAQEPAHSSRLGGISVPTTRRIHSHFMTPGVNPFTEDNIVSGSGDLIPGTVPSSSSYVLRSSPPGSALRLATNSPPATPLYSSRASCSHANSANDETNVVSHTFPASISSLETASHYQMVGIGSTLGAEMNVASTFPSSNNTTIQGIRHDRVFTGVPKLSVRTQVGRKTKKNSGKRETDSPGTIAAKKRRRQLRLWMVQKLRRLFLTTAAEINASIIFLVMFTYYNFGNNRAMNPFEMTNDTYERSIIFAIVSAAVFIIVFIVTEMWIRSKYHGISLIAVGLEYLFASIRNAWMLSLLIACVIILDLTYFAAPFDAYYSIAKGEYVQERVM